MIGHQMQHLEQITDHVAKPINRMPEILQDFPPKFRSSMDPCRKIVRSGLQCHFSKARWRFRAAGPGDRCIYICIYLAFTQAQARLQLCQRPQTAQTDAGLCMHIQLDLGQLVSTKKLMSDLKENRQVGSASSLASTMKRQQKRSRPSGFAGQKDESISFENTVSSCGPHASP